jgi:predicted DNA binding CopG/RHH family protein
MNRKKPKLKKLPVLKTNEEAERFVDTADLSQYDLSVMVPVRFEFLPKTERVNIRLPESLLNAVRHRAADAGVPYQRYIRLVLERAVAVPETQAKRSKAKAG